MTLDADEEMRDEYDFRGGVRGKYYRQYISARSKPDFALQSRAMASVPTPALHPAIDAPPQKIPFDPKTAALLSMILGPFAAALIVREQFRRLGNASSARTWYIAFTITGILLVWATQAMSRDDAGLFGFLIEVCVYGMVTSLISRPFYAWKKEHSVAEGVHDCTWLGVKGVLIFFAASMVVLIGRTLL